MKCTQIRAIRSEITKKINSAYPNTKMGEWMKQYHRISYQEISNANNSKQLISDQIYRRV